MSRFTEQAIAADINFAATEANILRHLVECGYHITKLQDSYVLHKPGSLKSDLVNTADVSTCGQCAVRSNGGNATR